MVLLLGVLAAVSLMASALSAWAAIALSVPVLGYAAWTARRYMQQPVRTLVIPGAELPPTLDGVVLHRFSLQWRGPLAFMAWQHGKGATGHLIWWPDTLDARQRRELRLAAGDAPVSATAAAVAP